MTSHSNVVGKMATLGGLYFVQGLPYGLQDKLMPILLISAGHSPTSVALTRLLLLPWLSKAAFAPFVDMTLTKRKWVQLSLVALVLTTLWNVIFDLPTGGEASTTITDTSVAASSSTITTTASAISRQLLVTLLCLNFFSAVQDIAVDGIALAILSTELELAGGNSTQIVGYKLGSFFGSACLFAFYTLAGWRGLFASLAVVYLAILGTFTWLVPSGGDTTTSTSPQRQLPPSTAQTRSKTKDELNPHLCSISMRGLLVYVLLYKLGEVAALATFPIFLTWSGGATSGQLVFWNGTVGVVGSIIGSLLGSIFSLRHLRLMLAWRLFPLALQLAVIMVFNNLGLSIINGGWIYYLSILSMLLLQLLGGLITTLTFTLMMSTCQRAAATTTATTSDKHDYGATRYSLVSSVEVFGKLLFSSLSGLVVETIGFAPAQATFLLASVLPILSLGF